MIRLSTHCSAILTGKVRSHLSIWMINNIINKINSFLHAAIKELTAWLRKMLPRVIDEWWLECVLSDLSYEQRSYSSENGFSKLEHLDLAALLRITGKSWYDIRTFT